MGEGRQNRRRRRVEKEGGATTEERNSGKLYGQAITKHKGTTEGGRRNQRTTRFK